MGLAQKTLKSTSPFSLISKFPNPFLFWIFPYWNETFCSLGYFRKGEGRVRGNVVLSDINLFQPSIATPPENIRKPKSQCFLMISASKAMQHWAEMDSYNWQIIMSESVTSIRIKFYPEDRQFKSLNNHSVRYIPKYLWLWAPGNLPPTHFVWDHLNKKINTSANSPSSSNRKSGKRLGSTLVSLIA